MNKCPKCGGVKGFSIMERGVTLEYVACWGDSESNVELGSTHHTRPTPKYVRCWECGKLVLRSNALKNEEA